ncbi:MAG: hypothetical protein HYV40_05060 [Candidatus Levybacteria bacterium]|nr:hypothetical protein [Candidatus Levybacteria bacterium]
MNDRLRNRLSRRDLLRVAGAAAVLDLLRNPNRVRATQPELPFIIQDFFPNAPRTSYSFDAAIRSSEEAKTRKAIDPEYIEATLSALGEKKPSKPDNKAEAVIKNLRVVVQEGNDGRIFFGSNATQLAPDLYLSSRSAMMTPDGDSVRELEIHDPFTGEVRKIVDYMEVGSPGMDLVLLHSPSDETQRSSSEIQLNPVYSQGDSVWTYGIYFNFTKTDAFIINKGKIGEPNPSPESGDHEVGSVLLEGIPSPYWRDGAPVLNRNGDIIGLMQGEARGFVGTMTSVDSLFKLLT